MVYCPSIDIVSFTTAIFQEKCYLVRFSAARLLGTFFSGYYRVTKERALTRTCSIREFYVTLAIYGIVIFSRILCLRSAVQSGWFETMQDRGRVTKRGQGSSNIQQYYRV